MPSTHSVRTIILERHAAGIYPSVKAIAQRMGRKGNLQSALLTERRKIMLELGIVQPSPGDVARRTRGKGGFNEHNFNKVLKRASR